MPEVTWETYSGPRPPFAASLGPRSGAKIAIVGEAWGEQEDITGKPFIGSAGQELTRLLTEAGINRREVFLTNVFSLRPARNDPESLCVPKALAGATYPLPPLRQGKYFHPKFLPELDRLKEELLTVAPNLIVACGNTACWALLRQTAISSIRGATAMAVLCPGVKLIPTYHPSAVLRNWALRPIVVADLLKVDRESQFPELRRPKRLITINPTLAEIAEWFSRPAQQYAVDIETMQGQITMIGFARSPEDALVIPFVDLATPTRSYWSGVDLELAAWGLVAGALAGPTIKVFQNGLYDLQYILRMGMTVANAHEDTMLLHHALFPELQKGLGFLGSIYSNEVAWKLMRHNESLKRDE